MRKLIIMRGPQGVGKSSLCVKLGLDRNRISADELRLILGSPELDAQGNWTISQDPSSNAATWALFRRLATERMDRGETLILDAMFVDIADIHTYRKYAVERGYKVALADFTSVPMERAMSQNEGRAEVKRVHKKAIERTYMQFEANSREAAALKGLTRVAWREDDEGAGMESELMAWIKTPSMDLSTFDRVAHYGDLQGCWTVLAGPGGPLENGLDPKVFHIFCGDLLDRGIENGKVARWFAKTVVGAPNAALIWGNHEDHLWRYAMGMPAVSREFERRTQPDLVAHGVDPEMARTITDMAVDLFPYLWRGKQVVVNHAGLTGLPPRDADGVPRWELLSRRQLSKGAGNYSDDVDLNFERLQAECPEALRWTQVHGHRNNGMALMAQPLSINLENEVEFGGALRTATLSDAGWVGAEYPNKIYATWRERFSRKEPVDGLQGSNEDPGNGGTIKKDKETRMDDKEGNLTEVESVFAFDVKAPIPSWIKDAGSAPAALTPATIAAMKAHDGVLEKPMPDRPHISSLNFTRDVFYDKKWDEVVVKARGLFYNPSTGEVAARGYNKFFNIGERPDTELSSLAGTLKFPVVGYLKENGFLGNLGYDSARDELMFASKSTTGGEFAGWFKEIFEACVPAEKLDEIKRYLRSAETSLVFEVMDPVRDPHMIKYAKPKIVLLDAFHRSEDGLKLPFDELQKLGRVFGIEVKRRMFEFKNMQGLTGWISSAYKDLSYRHERLDIEGVVFEDKSGFQTKCKLPHYSFWKTMRTSQERIGRQREKRELILEQIERKPSLAGARTQELEKIEENMRRTLEADSHPLARAFLAWCAVQPLSSIARDVIATREDFDAQVGIDPSWLLVKWDRFDPTEKESPKVKPSAALIDVAKAPKM